MIKAGYGRRFTLQEFDFSIVHRRGRKHGNADVVAVDIVGPFPESESGNTYVLVAGDYFTRWMEAYAIPSQEATTVA